MPNQIYEGQVRVDDKKADGSKLVIGKGDRKGEPYYKVAFKVGDEWINLMDFEGVTGGQGGEFRVEYYQKFAPNGEPELFNGKAQYQLVDIAPLGSPKTAQRGPSAASSAAPSVQTAENPDKQRSIEIQTIIKAWAEVKAGSKVTVTEFAADVLAIHGGVFGKEEAAEAPKTTDDGDPEDGDEDIPF